ncbi:Peptidyl-prolyl cis-trans isomerase fkbp4 [Bonamia ostreae]|uniref:peptidylprolyl isomerase n=1 Tax=Bonamia ostreae TaxID=126728 RepID=A0ABV2AQD7_9EUKA
MKIGEKSDLFCTAPYAYGEKGSGASIPPNSTLKFQIELLKADFPSITSDGQIKKEILKKGSGLDSPSSGSTCKIVYSARYGTSSPKQFIAEQSKTIIADEGVSPSGLVTALENMKAGEKSKFFISEGEHHFHPDDLPPSMDRADLLEYTIELKSFEKKKNVYEMSDDEKLSEAKVAREKGNLWFGKNRFANAEKRYEYAISCLEDIEGVFGPDSMEDPLLKSEDGENEKGESKEDEDKSNDEEESKIAEEAKKVILASLNNLAAVKIKKEKWDEVIENGEKALRIDRLNIKTLYRIAEAKAAKGQFDEAVLEIEKCFESAKISEKQRFLMKRKKMEFLRKKKESQRIVDSMYKRMSEGFGERAKK